MDIGESQVPHAVITSFEDSDGQLDEERNQQDEEVKGKQSEIKEKPLELRTEEELLYCKHCEYQASHLKDCLISCNGEAAWNQHLLGQKHRKVLEKKSMTLAAKQKEATAGGVGGGPMRWSSNENMHFKKPYEKVQRTVRQPNHSPTEALGAKDFAKYPEPLIGLEYVTEIQVIGQSPRYHCSLCDSKFDHNLKFPHLVGAKHRMNVLKIKKPAVIGESRNQAQKRSELTAMLLREARQLEQEEGRKQVKTKVAPGAATGPVFVTARERGGRGNQGYRGSTIRGARGASRGHQQHSHDYGRSSGDFVYENYQSGPGQLNMPYNESFDNYMSSYRSSFPSLSRDPYSVPPPQPNDNYTSPRRGDHSIPVNDYSPRSYTSSSSSWDYPSYPSPKDTYYESSPRMPVGGDNAEGGRKPDISAGLATALGDLTKLVQNEDDASVALHVSNALTQALLKYRMVNLKDEESASE